MGGPVVERLTDEELETGLKRLSDWEVQDGHLWRTVTFPGFPEAVAFVQDVADVAEDYEHHPDVHLHYDEVSLEVWTHEVDGLTAWDLELAARLDAILERGT